MADIQKAIVIGDVHTNLIDPVTGKSVNYKEVTTWYDGTSMDTSKVDGDLYTRKGTKFLRKVIDKDGELFLEKDTVAQLRATTAREILYLKAGVYKGIKLNGYYTKGDTPAPIEYYFSTNSNLDDGFSVFEVSGIKLEHEFKSDIDMSYIGLKDGDVINSKIMSILGYTTSRNLWCIIPSGRFYVDKGFIPPFNSRIKGMGRNSTTLAINPLTAINDDPPFLEHYVINAHNSGLWLTDIELDANASNITSSRSSGINATNNITNVILERIRIKNAKTILPSFSGGYGITSWGNASNVTINDIEFENIGQSDLGIFEGSNWYVTNVKSKNCGYMVVNIESSTGSTVVKDIVVDGVFASNVGRSVVSLIRNNSSTGAVESCVVRNVFVDKCSLTNETVGAIRVRATKDCALENVVIGESFGSGIVISGDQGFATENLKLNNITINKITASTGGYGVLASTSESTLYHKNINLSNINLPTSYLTGVLLQKVKGLNITNLSLSGSSTARGFQTQDCTDIVLNNVRVLSATSYGMVFFDSTNINIINSYVGNCATSGILLQGLTDNCKITNITVEDTRTPMTLNAAITIESSLSAKNPKIIVSNSNIDKVLSLNKIVFASGVVRDNAKIFNNIGVSDNASITTKGLVNQSVASPDTAPAPSATYHQSEVQAILTELRDLKAKLRTAGILAP